MSDDPSNYRPVSLTSVPSKVLESIIRDHLLDHLMSSGQLTSAQHGFLTQKVLRNAVDFHSRRLTEMLERGEPVDIAYLDFKKAFDSVPHKRLISNMHSMGIRGKLLHWIEAFLLNRRRVVAV